VSALEAILAEEFGSLAGCAFSSRLLKQFASEQAAKKITRTLDLEMNPRGSDICFIVQGGLAQRAIIQS
jgi:hypothetical protein